MITRSGLSVVLVILACSSALALPRLERVRTGQAMQGYFRYQGTDTEFVPRGNDFIRVSSYTYYVDGMPQEAGYVSTFQPGHYDSSAIETTLSSMESYGYNVVRTGIDWGVNGIAGDYNVPGLDPGYLDNVADFIRRADAHGIYVLLVMDLFPQDSYYESIANQNSCSDIADLNAAVMCLGPVNAKAQYFVDFITAMKARLTSSQMSAIMAYELANEQTFQANFAPFNTTEGVVTPFDGVQYNMAVPEERQQAADANLVLWANVETAAIHSVDPDAMVAVGFFSYAAVGKTGPNGLLPVNDNDPFPGRPAVLTIYSDISFIDIHFYPGDRPLETDLNSLEWVWISGPVIMGELGALKDRFQYDIVTAAFAMSDAQIESCSYHFKGWLFWLYDSPTNNDAIDGTYNLLESSGAINGVLAPVVRPNACSY